MKKIYLVSCVSRKKKVPAPAKDLYTSVWFRKAKRFVEDRRGKWFILSAKYGLLHPEEVVEPYDSSLHHMAKKERKAWARGVLQKLEEEEFDEVVLLAGKVYREFIEGAVPSSVPMRGLGRAHK